MVIEAKSVNVARLKQLAEFLEGRSSKQRWYGSNLLDTAVVHLWPDQFELNDAGDAVSKQSKSSIWLDSPLINWLGIDYELHHCFFGFMADDWESYNCFKQLHYDSYEDDVADNIQYYLEKYH